MHADFRETIAISAMIPQQANVTNLSHDERVQISELIMGILENWQVPAADQVELLGLPAGTRPRSLKRYHEGTPLPEDPAIWERISHLAGIADALRTSYPRNHRMASVWLVRSNSRFGNRTPLATMLEDGLIGINAVHMHLDCSFDWHIDAQVAAARAKRKQQ
ncbi:MAG: DUF2384 domain-containing protein [Acidiferrobacterales bacterium]|nr:DUF2384 domain-containing protein [Acidiferrobacterales bacterium]